MRETFIIRTEWFEAIQELDPIDQAVIFRNLFHFHRGEENLINLNNLNIKLVWRFIEPNLKRNVENYDKRKDTSAQNGRLGGRPKESSDNQEVTKNESNLNNLKKPNEKPNETKKPNETLNVFVSVTEDSKESKEKISKKEISVKYTPDFLEWWTLYDKVEAGGKKQCFEKWQKLPTHERQKIIEHTAHYVKVQSEKQYRKNPITYLNQKPYEDFLIGAGATSPTQDNSIEALRQRKIAEHESYKQLWGRIPSVQ